VAPLRGLGGDGQHPPGGGGGGGGGGGSGGGGRVPAASPEFTSPQGGPVPSSPQGNRSAVDDGSLAPPPTSGWVPFRAPAVSGPSPATVAFPLGGPTLTSTNPQG